LFGSAQFKTLDGNGIIELSKEIPVIGLGKSVIEGLVESGIANSNGEAKRLINGGAVSINDEKITSDAVISEVSLLKKGKNSFVLFR